MSADNAQHYRQRFQWVITFIDGHLESDLSVDQLSALAHFSRFHFHRQFSALFGLGVYRYLQLKRLKRAAYQLAYRQNTAITRIALTAGYETLEPFSWAFKQNTAARHLPPSGRRLTGRPSRHCSSPLPWAGLSS